MRGIRFPALGPGSLAGNAAITAIAFAISRVLGVLRETLLAAQFGTSEDFDAYLAAFRIPDLLFVLVMSGAFGSAFIPVFSGFLARNDEASATRLANTLLSWTLVILSAFGLLLATFASPLISMVIAPELSPRAQGLAIDLTRLLLLSPLLLGLGAAAKGMLESRGNFIRPAIAPILYNIGIILGILLLAPTFGVYGIAIGVIVGAALNLGIQAIELLRQGFRFRPHFATDTPGLARVVRLLTGRISTQIVGQANLLVTTNIASRLGEGIITSVSLAQHVIMLPHGIIAMALSTVIFPTLSRFHETGDIRAYRNTLLRALGAMFFLTIPVWIILTVFSRPIVHTLFAYGSFRQDSIDLVSGMLAIYALGTVARSGVEPLTRAFYAANDSRTPLIILTLTTFSHIVVGIGLSRAYGPNGLAVSLAISTILRMALMVILLSRRTPGLGAGMLRQLARMAIPAVLATIAALPLIDLATRLTAPEGSTTDRLFGTLAFGALVGLVLVVYLIASWLLRVPELRDVVKRLRRRM